MKLFDNLDAAKSANVKIKSHRLIETSRGVAWSCTVYLGSQKLGMVSNDGSGAMTRVEFGIEQQKQVMDALKAAGYQLKLAIGDILIEEPTAVGLWFEFAIAQMGDEVAEVKSLKRRARTHTLLEQRKEPYFAAYKAQDTPLNRAMLERQLGDDLVRFLNETIQAY